jgi:hypothetical protein
VTGMAWVVTLAGAALIALVNLYFLGPRRR